MKQFLNDHQLKNMTVPTAKPNRHQAELRRVLISLATQKARPRITLRGAVHIMTKRNILAGAGVTALLAITVATFAISTPTNVNALQVAQNSSKALADMTPAEAEYKKFYPYFVEWMSQAQKAPDLRLLDYNQVVKAYPSEMGTKPLTVNEPLRVIDDPSDNTPTDIRQLRYLEFTITYDDGFDSVYKVIVGVNTHDIPEAAFTHFVSGKATPKIGG